MAICCGKLLQRSGATAPCNTAAVAAVGAGPADARAAGPPGSSCSSTLWRCACSTDSAIARGGEAKRRRNRTHYSARFAVAASAAASFYAASMSAFAVASGAAVEQKMNELVLLMRHVARMAQLAPRCSCSGCKGCL